MANQRQPARESSQSPATPGQAEATAAGAQKPAPSAAAVPVRHEPAWPSSLSEPLSGQPLGFTPFGFVRRMMDDLDRLMTAVGGGLPSWRSAEEALPAAAWSPRIEVFRRGDQFVVRADLPGLRNEDIRITATDEVLSIEGERREQREQREAGLYRSEVSYGSFRRSIALPEGTDIDSVSARFDNGVLEVTAKLPASAAREPRVVEVESEPGATAEKKPESVH